MNDIYFYTFVDSCYPSEFRAQLHSSAKAAGWEFSVCLKGTSTGSMLAYTGAWTSEINYPNYQKCTERTQH